MSSIRPAHPRLKRVGRSLLGRGMHGYLLSAARFGPIRGVFSCLLLGTRSAHLGNGPACAWFHGYVQNRTTIWHFSRFRYRTDTSSADCSGRGRLREAMRSRPKRERANGQLIISRLSRDDRALLEPHLEPADLPLRKVLEQANKPKVNYGRELISPLQAGTASARTTGRLEVCREGSLWVA
jgi:hypothetical protein